jgi:potassium-transporting ATPase potassium-binding subunit
VTVGGWLQIALLLAVLMPLTPVLGGYIDRVFKGERVLLARARPS